MTLRQVALIVIVGFALASPPLQALGHIGLSPAAFSRAGDDTLRAAGYAFSIWGLIYAGLLGFGIYQALPRNRNDAAIGPLAVPAAVAILGTGLWIWASAFEARWASVAIITGSAACLAIGLIRTARRTPSPNRTARLLLWSPLALLAGWLTLASALNVLTVLTAEGMIGAERAQFAAAAGLISVLIVTVLVLRVRRIAIFGGPVAWGLVAVWVAEYPTNPQLAALAMGAAVLIAADVLWRSRPRALRPAPSGDT